MAMPLQEISFPIAGGSNIQRAAAFDSQQSINWYPYKDTVEGETIMTPFAGSQLQLTADVGEEAYKGRPGGMLALELTSYIIIGKKVFELDVNFNQSEIGEIGTTTGSLDMCAGGNYILIVDGTGGWTYNIITSDFDQITDPAFPTSPTTCEEYRGYFLVNDADTQKMYQSAIYNPTKWDVLLIILANYRSCPFAYPLIGIKSVNGRIFAFSTGFIEVYEEAPKAGFAFKLDSNLIFGYGAIALQGIAKGTAGEKGQALPEFLCFLSRTADGTRKIMMTSGSPPKVVSTSSIEYRLSQLTVPSDVTAFTWSEGGQTFVHFNFTTDDLTLVYNVTGDYWFDLQYNGDHRYFAQAFMSFRDKKLVTSYLGAQLYRLSEDYITNVSTPITRTRVTKNMRITGYKNFTGYYLELYFQQGESLVGDITPDTPDYVYGADAQVFLYISNDGGQTYLPPMQQPIGLFANRMATTRFKGLGTAKDYTFKIVIMAPIKTYLMGAMLGYIPVDSTG